MYVRCRGVGIVSVLLLFILILPLAAVAGELEEAVLNGEWLAVYNNLETNNQIDKQVKEFLTDIACLQLEIDCNTYITMFALDQPSRAERAKKWLANLAKDNPENTHIAYMLGVIASGDGDFTSAETHLYNAIEYDSSNAAPYLQLGVMLAVQEKYYEAIKFYNKAIACRPEFSRSYLNRGATYDGLSQYEEALSDYETAIKLNPNAAQYYYNRGNTYRHMTDNMKAIEDYSLAISMDSSMAAVYYNRANAYFDEGMLAEALEDYEKSLTMLPPELSHMKPQLEYQIDKLSAMLADKPDDEASRVMQRGIMKFEMGELQAAKEILTSAIEMDSTISDAYYYRAAASMSMGATDEAIADFGRTITYKPNDTTAYYNRGRLYADMNEHQKAIADYSSAIELNERYGLAYYQRGKSYEFTNQTAKAIADYEKFVRFAKSTWELERKEEVKEIIKLLKSEPPVTDDPEAIKTAVYDAYYQWEKKNWPGLGEKIVTDDLKEFRELSLPTLESLFDNDGSDFVLIDSMVISKSNIKKMSPEQLFAFQAKLYASDRFPFGEYFNITVSENVTILPRGDKAAMYTIPVTVRVQGEGTGMMVEGKAVKEDGVWKIKMPDLFMNIARQMNQAKR